MQIEVYADAPAVGQRAAGIVAHAIRRKPGLVLGLATGKTPISTYAALVDLYRRGGVDFAQATTFNLDEYVNLRADDPRSYHTYMREHLFRHVNLRPDAVHIPRGDAPDLDMECSRYETAIHQSGEIDVQVLGIGRNGHIGFNEPGADWSLPTHVVDLSEETQRANAAFFGGSAERVPKQAISMGIATIMRARRLLLLATGESKASIVQQAVEGPVSRNVPASVLQRHNDAVVLLDATSAAHLRHHYTLRLAQ